jgi:ribosome-associated heat shock protein Hsp15
MPRRSDETHAPVEAAAVRLDVWLWAARFYKTRSLAAAAAAAGQVQLNEQRVKPAHAVRVGDVVTVRRDALVWQAVVTGVAARRGSATDAAKLYREPDPARAAREAEIARRRTDAAAPRFPGRPTKRERRRLEDFLDEP